jgi:hypothetical protein
MTRADNAVSPETVRNWHMTLHIPKGSQEQHGAFLRHLDTFWKKPGTGEGREQVTDERARNTLRKTCKSLNKKLRFS